MKIGDFNFDYPEGLVAQHPLPNRDDARMMVVDRATKHFQHSGVRHLPEFFRPGDVVVVNRSKVIPARLIGRKESGGKVEILLLRQCATATCCGRRFPRGPSHNTGDTGNDAATGGGSSLSWWCLTSHTKRLKSGVRILFSDELSAMVGERNGDEVRMTFECVGNFEDILNKIGLPPLPPYIVRKSASDYSDEDRTRYQTVFAREVGSAAAPTAGLHLTDAMLAQLRNQGVQIAEVVLHVGRDTFQPVRVENIADHKMHGEEWIIPEDTADMINRAKFEGRRVIAVGTTSVRALESAWDMDQGKLIAGNATTKIFMTPGYIFRVIDGLLTNFHQPKSTLLMLVSALLGRERTLDLYAAAIRERYRLFSFGDCMLIV